MITAAISPSTRTATAPSPWMYDVLDVVDSTNSYAARLPAWTAVRAKTQTAGRGRTRDRRWVSDAGGLWLSAVLPCPGPRATWETLPLVAGAAVLDAVAQLGVAGARLRWPNDVMVGRAKLAGLLVERHTADTAVVGIGLNVFNRPEMDSPELTGQTARLCALVCGEYEVDDVAAAVLGALHGRYESFVASGFSPIAKHLNAGWAKPRQVEVTLHGAAGARVGLFHGVDERGRLRVTFGAEPVQVFDATEVTLLRECE